jgi:hypothetical protein
MTHELGGKWKEEAVAYFNILHPSFGIWDSAVNIVTG